MLQPRFLSFVIALFSAFPSYAEKLASAERLDAIAQRGAQVMPFSLEQTLHVFSKTAKGGIQQVIVKDATDTDQVRLIREHLSKISSEFTNLDFSDPEKIHGQAMPGLAEMRKAKAGQISVKYTELPNGAQIEYSTELPNLIDAIHRWFDAQLSDHARHAIAGHEVMDRFGQLSPAVQSQASIGLFPFEPDHGGPAGGTDGRHDEGLFPARPFRREGLDDFRNDIAGSLDDHGVADPDVFFLHFVLVVESCP